MNTSTPRGNQHVNSPHSFSETSVRQCSENEDNHQVKRCDTDITPNTHNYPTKKFMVLVRRMKVSIFVMKGLRTGRF